MVTISSSVPPESANVADDGPTVVLRQVPPRWHGTPSIGDLPEDLAVRLFLDSHGRPVCRFWIQRDRCRAIPFALVSVAGHAVHLGDLLAPLRRRLVARERVLLRLCGVWCYPWSRDLGRGLLQVPGPLVINMVVMTRSPPARAASESDIYASYCEIVSSSSAERSSEAHLDRSDAPSVIREDPFLRTTYSYRGCDVGTSRYSHCNS